MTTNTATIERSYYPGGKKCNYWLLLYYTVFTIPGVKSATTATATTTATIINSFYYPGGKKCYYY